MVVAAVVLRPRERGERELFFFDQVDAPHFSGVHADLRRKHVHGALDGGRRLGAAGPPVRRRRHRVGHDRPARKTRSRYVVGPRQHHLRERREDRPYLGIGTRVLDHFQVVSAHLAVARPADRDVLDLASPVAEPEHALRAGLGPAHRQGEAASQPGDEQLVGVRAGLGAKPATDVGGNDPDAVLVHVEDLGQLFAYDEGVLRGGVVREAAVLTPGGGRGPNLQGAGRHPLVDDPLAHDHLATLKDRLVAFLGDAGRDVGAGLGEEQDVAVNRHFRVDDRGQRVVINLDELGRVDRLRLRAGHDGRHWLAHITHHTVGEEGRAISFGESPISTSLGARSTSAAVTTARTPGAWRASEASARVIRAWAKGDRT